MKMKTQLTTLFAVAALFLASCAAPTEAPQPQKVNLDEVRVEIQQMEDAYAAAEKAKDADGVAAYYSDDAVNHNPNEEPTAGKAAIRERVAQRLASDTTGNYNVYKIVDLYAEGDMAVEIGSWTVMNPAGEEVDRGHYMSYFQKRDGKYVCVRDMNISSVPKVPVTL